MVEASTQAQVNNTSLADFLKQKGIEGIGPMDDLTELLAKNSRSMDATAYFASSMRQYDQRVFGREDFTITNFNLNVKLLFGAVIEYFTGRGYQEVPLDKDSPSLQELRFRKGDEFRKFWITGASGSPKYLVSTMDLLPKV